VAGCQPLGRRLHFSACPSHQASENGELNNLTRLGQGSFADFVLPHRKLGKVRFLSGPKLAAPVPHTVQSRRLFDDRLLLAHQST
jgi:hypothetical protein